MTISNNSNSNTNNEEFTPSVRSAYKFFNSKSEVDNTVLSFTYWNSLLKITMNPIQVQEGSANKVDTNNHIDIYLSPSKAQMFLHCIQKFRENPDKYKNMGVPTNKGIIYIANGEKMYGKKGTFIVINIIDENGKKNGEAAYEINTDVYGIYNYVDGNTFDKYYDYSESIELDMIETLLKSYVEAYSNAVASSILENNKYNDNRIFSFIKDVRDKLGITKSEGNGNKYNNKSNWHNNNSFSSVSSNSPKTNSVDYDEVMNDISATLMD